MHDIGQKDVVSINSKILSELSLQSSKLLPLLKDQMRKENLPHYKVRQNKQGEKRINKATKYLRQDSYHIGKDIYRISENFQYLCTDNIT